MSNKQILFCIKFEHHSDGILAARWASENMTNDKVTISFRCLKDFSIDYCSISFDVKDGLGWDEGIRFEAYANLHDFFVATKDESGKVDFDAQKESPYFCSGQAKEPSEQISEQTKHVVSDDFFRRGLKCRAEEVIK